MSSMIQTEYGRRSQSISVRSSAVQSKAVEAVSFLAMAKSRSTLLRAGNRTATDLQQIQTDHSLENTKEVKALSLEEMLKAKYPNLAYHVLDASTSAWRTRNDYPHYLLYQQNIDEKALENWKPKGQNPFYGSIDGRFIAPKEIRALGNVPPGSKAVVIHPKVQARMEEDPAYAGEIMERIQTWFAFDVARNEAIMPGSTMGMSQSVAIGEDGSIVNAQSSRAGGEITQSSDEMVRAYYLRLAKRADFMRWLVNERRENSIQAADRVKAEMAKAQLAEMINGGKLQAVFGNTIAGVSTQAILAITKAQVWGDGAGIGGPLFSI